MLQRRNLSVTETACRSCGSAARRPILDLGATPLADQLVRRHCADDNQPVFPLEILFCEDCSLVQLGETVAADILYADRYPYFSSFSPALLAHSRKHVLTRIAERNLDSESFVVEIASNDGYLLKNYVEQGIPVLGIDPADGPVADARKIGVRSLCDFFSEALARAVVQSDGKADVVHANNVLAHVGDINDFVRGIHSILDDDGVAVFEMPYVLDLIEEVEFDTIYHEHHCYFSLTALDKLFRRHELFVNRVERLTLHGGSLRVFVEHEKRAESSVIELLAEERVLGLDTAEFYLDFACQVAQAQKELVALIERLRDDGKTIAAYGAAAKGATLLNTCGIGRESIDFVVDRNVNKHGLLMPGSKIPICAPDVLLEKRPDYVLVLAWNFIDEIKSQQAKYLGGGGKFIVPVPTPVVLR